ncbi:DUF547 domain-containing protein [Psychroflexus sp. CAK57W]|uniref:DUF547 domain-containing protein n=1 Tax=Psychroflexus curvus TaxID=2873595 RepID=UPI001CCA29DA|nr:DUF547 domain-containing protein [Psychroflexus curvus]MBZ9787096.1 DUF547 domain-containing protein [Psychroflexus curvus]
MRIFRQIILVSSLILGTNPLQAQDIHQHQQWNQLLETYVDADGNVNYKAFKQNEKRLDAYLSLLNENPPDKSWTQAQKKAYLINAYNAYTVKLIIDNYPLESIRDIGGFFSNPFSTEFAKIGRKAYSLDDIEKGMLLKMGDPRVHFAVNCASESCPKLADEAYVASKLDEQLNAAARSFVNSNKNKLSRTDVELSKIFKWYASDFETDGNSVIKFINSYSDENISENASVSYLSYSWKLNEM